MDKIVEDAIVNRPRQWERDCMEISPGVNLFTLPGVSIFIANRPMDFPAGQHAHSEYEFVMPLCASVVSYCGARPVHMEKGQFTPFNSGQSHGVQQDTSIERMICISCDKEFLEQLALQGFGESKIHFENISFAVSHNMRFLLGMFVEESLAKKNGYPLMQDHLVRMLFTEIIRCSRNNILEADPAQDEKETTGIARAADFLREQVVTSFCIQEAASVAGMSPYHFIRAFKQHTGKTPYAYYVDQKIEKAKDLLHNKNISIMEVALAAGFTNSGHFSTLFKRKTGVTPSEYQKTIC